MKIKIKKSLLKQAVAEILKQQDNMLIGDTDQMAVGDNDAKFEEAVDQMWDFIMKLQRQYEVNYMDIINVIQDKQANTINQYNSYDNPGYRLQRFNKDNKIEKRKY